jgi:hypothetical protein
MSMLNPLSYLYTIPAATGWKNSVNQVFTAGQGIDFLAYDVEGSRNHQYMLLRELSIVLLLQGRGGVAPSMP